VGILHVVAWTSDNIVGHVVKEATLYGVWLIPRRTTVREHIVSIRNQPLRLTQPPILSRTGNEYRPMGSGSAVWLRRYGN